MNKQAKRFMADKHFTVDGPLVQAWTSQKGFRSKDGSNDSDAALLMLQQKQRGARCASPWCQQG